MKYDRQVALSAIFSRCGRGTFRYTDVADIVPDWRTLRYLCDEGALDCVDHDQDRGNTWQISAVGAGICAHRPPIAPGALLTYADAAILTVWQDRGRAPFRTAEFREAFKRARITGLVEAGYVEGGPGTHGPPGGVWRLTQKGAAYARSLACQVAVYREGASA